MRDVHALPFDSPHYCPCNLNIHIEENGKACIKPILSCSLLKVYKRQYAHSTMCTTTPFSLSANLARYVILVKLSIKRDDIVSKPRKRQRTFETATASEAS